jgi:DNA-binding transcriptional regulator LsrR (DeoR family)
LIEKALELKMEGKTLREIGKDMGISFQKVDRLIKAASKNSCAQL